MAHFGGISGEKLKQIVGQIEHLEEEKKAAQDYIANTYKEAKSLGFDTAVLRKLISQRKKDASKLSEEEEILDLYKHALGMVSNEEEGA